MRYVVLVDGYSRYSRLVISSNVLVWMNGVWFLLWGWVGCFDFFMFVGVGCVILMVIVMVCVG